MGNKASNGKLNTVSDPALLSQIPSAPIEEPSAVIVGEHDAVPVGNIAVTGRARDGDGDAPTAATEIDLFDEKVDLDAILDESLFEAAVGEELFPVCGDCSCCKGYVFACKCSHSSVERVKCTQCRDRFKHSGYAAGAWTQGTVAAATSAISSRLTPTLSRAPSARAQSDLLAASESDPGERNWSVRIYPQVQRHIFAILNRILKRIQLQGMPPQLCRMLVVPVVVNILSRSEHGSSLSWPDRGWAQQTDFDMEMEAAFNQNSIESSGVIIARALPRAEATFIAAKLAGLSVSFSILYACQNNRCAVATCIACERKGTTISVRSWRSSGHCAFRYSQ